MIENDFQKFSKMFDIAPHMEGIYTDFIPRMEGSHADFAQQMKRRHSFRDQK